MNAALDEIAFLANSPNRVEVLDALVDTSRTRDELRDHTGSARVTFGRVLRELEDRQWVVRRSHEYELTPLGMWIYEEFSHVVAELEAAQRMREAVRWLPSEIVTFDIRCLRDAEIIVLDGTDMTKLARRIREFHRSGKWIRGFSRGIVLEAVEAHWELAKHEGTRIEHVLTPEALAAIQADPQAVHQLRELLEVDHARCLLYEDIPLSVSIVDETVGITVVDERGIPQGGIGTDAAAVYEWAVDLFETYCENAEPIEPDMLTD